MLCPCWQRVRARCVRVRLQRVRLKRVRAAALPGAVGARLLRI